MYTVSGLLYDSYRERILVATMELVYNGHLYFEIGRRSWKSSIETTNKIQRQLISVCISVFLYNHT